jgi:hypothetical protein
MPKSRLSCTYVPQDLAKRLKRLVEASGLTPNAVMEKGLELALAWYEPKFDLYYNEKGEEENDYTK